MDGWIKLHRCILDNPVVMKDGDYLAIWTWLLLNATHKPYDVMFKGKRHTLNAGELTTGRRVISDALNINEHKVDRVLKLFENEQQIEQQTSNRCRLISIVSWDKYQRIEQQTEHQVNNSRATDEQQVSTKQEIKEYKEHKNIYIEHFDALWKAYPNKKGKSAVKDSKKKELLKEGDKVFRAIENYKADIRKNNTEARYIMHGSTFFNGRWRDYVEEGKEDERNVNGITYL